jgi:DNA-binding LacI/PurR family transcriptional regulator
MTIPLSRIAEKAGVSKSTVSRALNNFHKVNDETRERILSIALEMGYSQDQTVSSSGQHLAGIFRDKARETKTYIANLIFYKGRKKDIASNPYFSTLAGFLYSEFEKVGYSIIESYPQTPEEYRKLLRHTQSDGLLLSRNIQSIEQNLIPDLRLYSKTKPLIFVSGYIGKADSEFHSIRSDEVNAGHMAAQYLINKNLKTIFYIDPCTGNPVTEDRFYGYKRAMEENSLEVQHRAELPAVKTMTPDEIRKSYSLDRSKVGFVSVNDVYCIEFAEVLKAKGCLDMEKMYFTGMDGVTDFTPDDVRCATIKFDLESMAREAVNLFMHVYENPDEKPKRILTGGRLVEKENS